MFGCREVEERRGGGSVARIYFPFPFLPSPSIQNIRLIKIEAI
jgi:hypothetical protein